MFTWLTNINGIDYEGRGETIDEAEDRFCTFMCRRFDHYRQTRNVDSDGEVFGTIMDGNRAVGGYTIYPED